MNDLSFNNIKLLNSAEIRSLVSMEEAIMSMEEAFSSFSDGSSHVPQRHISGISKLNLFLKPAFNEKLNRIAVKVITQKNDINLSGTPTILGVVLLLDMESGAVLSMMDGACITALRTGAASGVAAKHLACRNADTMALFGCGAQGKTQLEAIFSARPIKRAFLYDLNEKAALKLKLETENRFGVSVKVNKSIDYLKDADIICTATNAESPLFSINNISKGTHINAVGSYKPTMQEIDPQILKTCKLYVDSKKSVLKESGDLIKPINNNIFTDGVIKAEIGELINKKAQGRTNENEITVFKSVGLGVQDLFMANLIYENYLKK